MRAPKQRSVCDAIGRPMIHDGAVRLGAGRGAVVRPNRLVGRRGSIDAFTGLGLYEPSSSQ